MLAFALVILILTNPDFLALGLLGDASFFDVLVLALSVQLLPYSQAAWHGLRVGVSRSLRWLGMPSPGLLHLLAILAFIVGTTVSTFQKIAHRFWS